MNLIPATYLTKNIGRISQLEMLDEIEELDLVLSHYAITWAAAWPTSDADPLVSKERFERWDMKWDSTNR